MFITSKPLIPAVDNRRVVGVRWRVWWLFHLYVTVEERRPTESKRVRVSRGSRYWLPKLTSAAEQQTSRWSNVADPPVSDPSAAAIQDLCRGLWPAPEFSARPACDRSLLAGYRDLTVTDAIWPRLTGHHTPPPHDSDQRCTDFGNLGPLL